MSDDIIRFSSGGRGPRGFGVPVGGVANQVLTKNDITDFNAEWRDPALQDLSGLQQILSEGAFVDGDKAKLDGIEEGANITRYVEGSTFTTSGIVGNDEIWKRCIVSMSGDTTLAISDGVSEGDQIAFLVFNPNRDRFVLTDQFAVELNYSNASYILVEMTYLSVSGWQALTFLDNPLKEKGDVMIGIGSNEKAHLPVGADGQVIVADSTSATGVRWGPVVAATNANLTGHITSTGNATVLGSFTIAQLSAAISNATLSGTNTGDQDLSPYQLIADESDSIVLVKSASDLSGVLLSSKVYMIDGAIDMGTQTITVPPGGLEIRGFGIGVSKLFSTANVYTMFVDAASDAGTLFISEVTIDVSGIVSKVFDLDNSGASGTVEMNAINFENCTSLGVLDAYRQFLMVDSFWLSCDDGLTFAGAWSGGAYIQTLLVRNFDPGLLGGTVFKGSASPALTFASRFACNGNINTPAGATVYDFEAAMFTNDASFELNEGSYTGAGTVIAVKSPVIDNTSTKSRHRDNRGLTDTYVGGRWFIAEGNALPTAISVIDTYVKVAATTTTTESLQWMSLGTNNDLTYNSTETSEMQVSGSINVTAASGGTDKNVTLTIRHWDNSAGVYVDLPNRARVVSTSAGTFHNVGLVGYVTLDINDRVELWIENNTDTIDITVESGSMLAISQRPN